VRLDVSIGATVKTRASSHECTPSYVPSWISISNDVHSRARFRLRGCLGLGEHRSSSDSAAAAPSAAAEFRCRDTSSARCAASHTLPRLPYWSTQQSET
jgi:hypothetical protein